jgi:hypothetical protein
LANSQAYCLAFGEKATAQATRNARNRQNTSRKPSPVCIKVIAPEIGNGILQDI